MFKILKEMGTMAGHDMVEIYKLGGVGLVAVNFDRSDGIDMEAIY